VKYSELIQFDPIESVIQLQEADSENKARQLVEDFVISESMAEKLIATVFPQLQFEKPADNKGLLIVGNYGTGKSHLMAVISAVAEHASLAGSLTNKSVASAANDAAGKFKVIRAEINTAMPLRDFVCRTVSAHLDEMGITYEFPKSDEVLNEKDALAEMMSEFQKSFPDQGLLLVVDELLDYLRSRKDQDLILDLNFLRAIGEFCKGSRFRFIAGVQESLFDNPTFQFVAETLRRVKDRFEQVRIAREDVAFVVAERLLKKTPEQQAQIREHLTEFAPLYSSMNERMDDFVRLFPVHPAYLEVFEKIYAAEKREILKTISGAISKMINQKVPAEEPGLIAYDSYWENLKGNPSFRSDNDIREVIDKSKVLEDRVAHAFPTPQYRPVATRIVHALSIHRLTTGDIYAPIGATSEELRDDLCLILPLPEKDVEFLKTLVEKVLKDTLKTVSGQFLSYNSENGQYYLDLKKDIDFESLIEKKATTLGPNQLDRYYFDALARVIECADETHKTGYKIWEHELEWRERKAGRRGYLFFGAPNERSTAQPPRDFYLYFIQPHDAPYFKDEKKADEVFFHLAHPDDALERVLSLYAGARELAATAAGGNKRIYEDKAAVYLKSLTKWLQDNALKAISVTHQGRTRSLGEVIQGKISGGGAAQAFRDIVNIAGSECLAPHFVDLSPDYPTFSVLITARNRDQAAQEALRWIGGGVKSDQGTRVLDALVLLDGDRLTPRDSKYAKPILDALAQKAAGQVLNRTELVYDDNGVEFWKDFRIEPELLAVVLAALADSGDLVISVPGAKIDAASRDELTKIGIETIKSFKHVEQPRDLPLAPLKELFKLLGISEGLIVNPGTREEAVKQLAASVQSHVERLVKSDAALGQGLTFWGQSVLSDEEVANWRKELQQVKAFLESLQAFNTVGKLKNFKHDVAAIQTQKPGLDRVGSVESLGELVIEIEPLTSYLVTAEAVLPREHDWAKSVSDTRSKVIARMLDSAERAKSGFKQDLQGQLGKLKESFKTAYVAIHNRQHLGPKGEKRKTDLLQDLRLSQLQKLAPIDILPTSQLKNFQDGLDRLKGGYVTPGEIDKTPICPKTQYRPVEDIYLSAQSAADRLGNLEDQLDTMASEWTDALVANLQDPTVQENIGLLADEAGKREIEDFLAKTALPEPVTPSFVKALQDVLSGLEKVVITAAGLKKALLDGGSPCTIDELKERFTNYVETLTKTKDKTKVRIVLEDPTQTP
jgi:predicted ATPase